MAITHQAVACSQTPQRKGSKVRQKRMGWLLTGSVFLAIGVSCNAQTPTPTATPPVGASNQLTPAQLLNSRSISDLRFSPNGEHVAFVVSEPVKGTTRARHIWLFS